MRTRMSRWRRLLRKSRNPGSRARSHATSMLPSKTKSQQAGVPGSGYDHGHPKVKETRSDSEEAPKPKFSNVSSKR